MNKLDCDVEKLSSRMIGLLILPFAIALGAIGFLVLPVVGLFFPYRFSCLQLRFWFRRIARFAGSFYGRIPERRAEKIFEIIIMYKVIKRGVGVG